MHNRPFLLDLQLDKDPRVVETGGPIQNLASKIQADLALVGAERHLVYPAYLSCHLSNLGAYQVVQKVVETVKCQPVQIKTQPNQLTVGY